MTLLEAVIDRLRSRLNVSVTYGRANAIDGKQITVTQDETEEDVKFAIRGFDIDIFAPGPDPTEIDRMRRDVEAALHYRLINASDLGAARVYLRSQSDVDDEEDWQHWTMRFECRGLRASLE